MQLSYRVSLLTCLLKGGGRSAKSWHYLEMGNIQEMGELIWNGSINSFVLTLLALCYKVRAAIKCF